MRRAGGQPGHRAVEHRPTAYLYAVRLVGDQGPRKNSGSHIDASHSRQPLVKGERLVRYEVNAVMHRGSRYSFSLV